MLRKLSLKKALNKVIDSFATIERSRECHMKKSASVKPIKKVKTEVSK